MDHFLGFVQGAIAACGAVTFTNPWELVKTRLQLQGELNASQRNPAYTSAVSTFSEIFKKEGIRGIQKGLIPAYMYQILLNGTRLGLFGSNSGLYPHLRDIIHTYTPDGAHKMFAMVLSGALSGVSGASIASPLFLVKTRMQSRGVGAVGFQHEYVNKGTLKTLGFIYRNEGLTGLWRGVDASSKLQFNQVVRTGVGSAVQLSTYDITKHSLLDSGLFVSNSVSLHFSASLVTSLFVCMAMNPFDVASTRMYNQPTASDGRTGRLYKNGLDCIVKTVKAEGFGALYKGFSAHYLRIGPHTILTFVFLEQAKKFIKFY